MFSLAIELLGGYNDVFFKLLFGNWHVGAVIVLETVGKLSLNRVIVFEIAKYYSRIITGHVP